MSKTGEIYEVISPSLKRYFQLVAYDETLLTSDVIAVFDYREELSDYSGDSVLKIIDSGVDFYTHTTVLAGVRQGLWKKIGSRKVIDFTWAVFKDIDWGDDIPEIESYEADSYHSWVVWGINKERRLIGANINNYPSAELGIVFPPRDVIYRMQNGKYPGPPYYGQSH